MIKKYYEFLNESDNEDLDPYGEEDWEDKKDIEVYREFAINLDLFPTHVWIEYEDDEDERNNSYAFSFKKGNMDFEVSCSICGNELNIVNKDHWTPNYHHSLVLSKIDISGMNQEQFSDAIKELSN